MKKIKYFYIIAATLLLMNGSCQKDDIVELGKCNLENVVKSVSDTKGTIWFDAQTKGYSIFSGIEGTYDSQIIGVVCNLPDIYKNEGVKIVFSGNYYNCDEYSPLIPGQKYYYLELTKVKSVSEN